MEIAPQQGFIKLVLLIVIALIVLGFFGFDIRDIIESPQVQQNLTYAWNFAKSVAKETGDGIAFVIKGAWDQAKEIYMLLKVTL